MAAMQSSYLAVVGCPIFEVQGQLLTLYDDRRGEGRKTKSRLLDLP